VPEAVAQDPARGDYLVVVVGLHPERRKAQPGGEDHQPGDDPEGP
jgi:hypothetical protein